MSSASLSDGVEPSSAGIGSVSACDAFLPERLDTSAAPALKELIEQAKAASATPVLDASGVAYIGGLCLQLLLAGGCTLAKPSEQVREAYALFGVSEYLAEPPVLTGEQ